MILWWPGPWTSEGMTSPPNYPVKRKVKEESKYTLQCCKSNQKFCVIPWVTEWCPRTVKLFEVVGRGQWPGPWTNGCTPWQSATRPGSGCVSSFILESLTGRGHRPQQNTKVENSKTVWSGPRGSAGLGVGGGPTQMVSGEEGHTQAAWSCTHTNVITPFRLVQVPTPWEGSRWTCSTDQLSTFLSQN